MPARTYFRALDALSWASVVSRCYSVWEAVFPTDYGRRRILKNVEAFWKGIRENEVTSV